METAQQELLLCRIISGMLHIRIAGQNYMIKGPTTQQRYIAQEIYCETLAKAKKEGLFTQDELMGMLIQERIWSFEQQYKLDDLQKNLEELRVKTCQLTLRSNELKTVREAIAITKTEISKLLDIKLSYSYLTDMGMATIAKTRYLVGCSTYKKNNVPIYKGLRAFYKGDSLFLNKIIALYNKNRISEEDFRTLARSDSWRNIWPGRKGLATLFPKTIIEWTDEQRSLVNWSLMYDNVYSHPECPSSTVINDNDLLDGWLILQRRKREGEDEKIRLEGLVTNPLIKDAEEVYIKVDTKEDAKKVDLLNDPTAMMIKRQREAYLKKKGAVAEQHMPDSQLKIRQLHTQMYADTVRSK